MLAHGRQVRAIREEDLVRRVLEQGEGGIAVAQRLVDARIGFVEKQHELRERGLRLVALQERRDELAESGFVVLFQQRLDIGRPGVPLLDQQAEILLQGVAAKVFVEVESPVDAVRLLRGIVAVKPDRDAEDGRDRDQIRQIV
jgi:hypothetical protein